MAGACLAAVRALCVRVQGSGEAPATVLPAKSVTAVRAALKECGVAAAGVAEAARRAYAEGRKMHAFGRVIVVATLTGELCLYENVGAPQWA